MGQIYDLAIEACDEAGEARILERALRGLDALDLAMIDGDLSAALEYVLLDAIADRLHAMAERLDARYTRALDLKAGDEI